ncbi:MAG: hypothetical protein C5B58_12040 [Acidobacteria bacterium]|nr:MAG: hypothetical protein C5B58_12040 [Acidobacteriota bacterium]
MTIVDSANGTEDSEARSAELGRMTHEQLTERNLRAGKPENADAMIDAQTKAEYRRKLEELREELEEVKGFRNPERIAQGRRGKRSAKPRTQPSNWTRRTPPRCRFNLEAGKIERDQRDQGDN